MLLPLYHLPSPFTFKSLNSTFPPSLPPPPLSHQNSKPFKFTVRSSTTPATTQTASKTAIKRIAEKLRNLGYIEEDENSKPKTGHGSAGEIFLPSPPQLAKNRVGYTIDSSWSTPENPVPNPGSGVAISRFHQLRHQAKIEKRLVKKEPPKEAPTLAELTLPPQELRRLRSIGIRLDKKLKVGVAGITEGIVNGIHERWRRNELVKIRCEDLCRMNMKRTHDTLERKTGGLVIWRSGSTVILYRGADYKYPYFLSDINTKDDESSSKSSTDEREKPSNIVCTDGIRPGLPSPFKSEIHSSLVQGVGSPNKVRFQLPGEAQLAEEGDRLLDGLGPRFRDWWGCEPLPVDADQLPAIIPGYRRLFRLLPYGLQPKLTDDEMTTLRRLSRPLPCHFVLGRNRNLQGLADSMIKLWGKCEIAKIAVKRGVQNTNSEMMAEELKRLTGGTLLSRDREFIVFYRGKDFLPPAVSTAIEERRKRAVGEKRQLSDKVPSFNTKPKFEIMTKEPISANELQQANEKKDRELVSRERKMTSKVTSIERVSTKLSMALVKKAEAEKLLEELEKAAEYKKPVVDKEGITEEERYMLRKVGLRMKPFLLLGRRGVFDGTVENMHLHWKYRELVKIISSERCIEDVLGAARTLEAESGGILVAVERVNRGYAIIMYRGKNYQRPVDLRPRSLLNKKQAMKRSIEAQRRESLKLHVLKLTQNIDQLKHQLGKGNMEVSRVQSNEFNRPYKDTTGSRDPGENSPVQNNDGTMEFANDQEAREQRLSYSTPLDSNSCADDSYHGRGTIHLDLPIASYAPYDKSSENELDTSYEPEFKEKHFTNIQDEVGGSAGNGFTSHPMNLMPQDEATCSASDKSEDPVSGTKFVKLPFKLGKDKFESPVHRDKAVKGSHMEVSSTAGSLSNKDRLLLRKQALKMKKRPVLAIGRSNAVTGVAKAIKTHFRKNPLAIVNVKGRAKGTSVKEVVSELEKATGAVLVSQEPSKVILYRGWGAEDYGGKENARTMTGREGTAPEVVSPQLLEAIRLECGLQSKNEEEIL